MPGLCGALLVAHLLRLVSEDLNITSDSLFGWSDSSAVLGWLNKASTHLVPFVARRVVRITEMVHQQHWRYVGTTLNPADLLSRGVLANELRASTLWWQGPP